MHLGQCWEVKKISLVRGSSLKKSALHAQGRLENHIWKKPLNFFVHELGQKCARSRSDFSLYNFLSETLVYHDIGWYFWTFGEICFHHATNSFGKTSNSISMCEHFFGLKKALSLFQNSRLSVIVTNSERLCILKISVLCGSL